MPALGTVLSTENIPTNDDGDTVALVNSIDASDNLTISRTFAGAGDGIDISMGGSTTGHGIRVDLAAGATGDGLNITDAGSGPAIFVNKTGGAGQAIDVQVAGQSAVAVTGAGSVSLAARANLLEVITTSGSMNVGSSIGGAGTAGDVDIISDATAVGATAGNITVASTSSGAGTSGGVVVSAGGVSAPAASAGAVTVTASDTISMSTSSGATTINTSVGGVATAGTITMQSDSTAAGATSGDIIVATISSGSGTPGGVVVTAGGISAPVASAGAVLVTASTSFTVTVGTQYDFTMPDNTANAFILQEGTNQYIDIDTTNASELARFGTDQITTAATLVRSGATADVTFDARGITTPLPVNEVGDINLDGGFTATSIVGALNELFGASVAPTMQVSYDNGPDITQDATGGIEVTKADASGNAEYVLRLDDVDDAGATNTLEINKAPAVTSRAGDAIDITLGINADGNGLHITQSSSTSARAILVSMGSSATTGIDVQGGSIAPTAAINVSVGGGSALTINNGGSAGNTLLVQRQSVNMLTVSGTGSILMQGRNGQTMTLDNATAGGGVVLSSGSTLDVDASGNITVDTSAGTISLGFLGASDFTGATNASGAGGALTLQSGSTTNSGSKGGDLSVTAGNGNGVGVGGNITLQAGQGGATGLGGDVLIQGGQGGAGAAQGGSVTINSATGLTDGDVILDAGSTGGVYLQGSSAGDLGFFVSTGGVAKQTASGSRAGNAALASLLTALSNYGLITDSTTA